jgi:ABC-type Na+ efflux pump permease subunit
MVARFPKNKKRGAWQQITVAVLLGIPVCVLIAFLGISDWRIYKNRADVDTQAAKLKQQIQTLQDQGAALKEGLDQANQDNFQEAKLRDQGYKKPGEEVWAVLGKTDPAKDAGQANTGNFWSDLWNKIKNINP